MDRQRDYKTTTHKLGDSFLPPEGYHRIDSMLVDGPAHTSESGRLVVLWAGAETPVDVISLCNELVRLEEIPDEVQRARQVGPEQIDSYRRDLTRTLSILLDLHGLRESA